MKQVWIGGIFRDTAAMRNVLFLILASLYLAGCARFRPPAAVVVPTFAGAAGVIEIVPAYRPAELGYVLPMTKSEGAEELAAQSVNAVHDPRGLIFLPLITPLSALVGAWRGVPEEKILGAESALTNTLRGREWLAELCLTLEHRGNALTGHRWKLAGAGSSPSAATNAPGSILRLEVSLAFVGLDTQVKLFGIEAVTSGVVNPSLAFVAEARCEAYSQTGELLLRRSWKYISGRHKFVVWGADDARRLREEYERSLATLAERIARDLFPVAVRK